VQFSWIPGWQRDDPGSAFGSSSSLLRGQLSLHDTIKCSEKKCSGNQNSLQLLQSRKWNGSHHENSLPTKIQTIKT
jgi:hypothetical protein